MITNPRINGIRQQVVLVDDPNESMVVVAVANDLTRAEAWAVDRHGNARKIGTTPMDGSIGKIDSAGGRLFTDGTFRLVCACADPGASGSTSHTEYFDFPNAFPGDVQLTHTINLRTHERIATPGTGANEAVHAIGREEAAAAIAAQGE